MNDLNLRRCSLVPKNTPGADWRSLVLHVRDHPDEETFNVRCSASSKMVVLVPSRKAGCHLFICQVLVVLWLACISACTVIQ